MIVNEIMDRLKAIEPKVFNLIGGAAEIASILKGAPATTPAAYVFTTEEASEDNAYATGVVRQRMEMDIAVVLIASNVTDPRGAAAMGDIQALKDAARTALLGWKPPSAEDVITHVSGVLVRAIGGYVWWQETFAAAVYLESAP